MKKIWIVLMLMSFCILPAKNLTFKFTSTGTGYYPEYTDYEYESPVTGIRFNAEIYNLLQGFGVGGTALFQLKSYDSRIDYTRFYDVYLHNFSTFHTDKEYMLWGFYGGVRNTKLEYIHYQTKLDTNLKMNRPLLGFKFTSESWGFDISWTQAENRKPILGYEVKLRGSTGMIFQIGRANRGPMIGADSDFHIYIGYEYFM